MFKTGDKVFDNERGYGEGVVTNIQIDSIIVDFDKGIRHSYYQNGSWFLDYPVTLFKKEKMKNYYYVGQKVSHQGYGDGVVINIYAHDEYPIVVEFKDESRSFTLDGRYNEKQHTSLSQKPHIPIELEEVVSFEEGELVWVKFYSEWCIRYYSHLDGKDHYVFNNQEKCGYSTVAVNIRKFSNNPLL